MTLEILTGLLVVITGVYAWLTRRLAHSSEDSVRLATAQMEAALRPYVEVGPYLPPGSIVFHLRVRNTGRTSAKSLRLTLDRDFFQYGDERPELNLRQFTAFTSPIEDFPPGAEMVFSLAQGFVILQPDANQAVVPRVFQVTATYSGTSGEYHENTTIDLRPFQQSWIGEVPLQDELKRIGEAVKDIAAEAKKIASHGGG